MHIHKILFIACTLILAGTNTGLSGIPSKGLFVTVLQSPQVLSSKAEIDKLILFTEHSKTNALFIQVYRANQAWFPSKIADSSPYQQCLTDCGEDPLQYLITRAHEKNIEVHAWMNLLSLSKNTHAPMLKKYGVGILTRNQEPKSALEDYMIDNQYFLEPSDERVRQDLAGIVKEVVMAYPQLDGIQLDYIRYPDVDPHYGYSPTNVAAFLKVAELTSFEDSNPHWHDWKRKQVTDVVELLVKTIRANNQTIQISTTGCTPFQRAFHEAFQNWPAWLDRKLIDFVTIMGYSPDISEFSLFIDNARKFYPQFNNINIAVGAYELAGKPDTFKEELQIAQDSRSRMVTIFHYESLTDNTELADIATKTL